MKYPKPWDAGSPAGRPYVGSYREGAHAGQIQIATYVNRPGTPNHTRLIRTWLTLDEADRLHAELTEHIAMVRSERRGEGQGVRESFDRIRRNRACYRCGASPEHCECPDEMEPDGAR
jgi:hypothetical protein